MKKAFSILISFLFLLALLEGCSDTSTQPEEPVQPTQPVTKTGDISIKVISTSLEVLARVEAYLVSNHEDTLAAKMELTVSDTARYKFKAIPEGDYHLTLKGYNSSGKMFFSDWSLIQIFGGTLTEITVSAAPSGAQKSWEKYSRTELQ